MTKIEFMNLLICFKLVRQRPGVIAERGYKTKRFTILYEAYSAILSRFHFNNSIMISSFVSQELLPAKQPNVMQSVIVAHETADWC